MANLLKVNTKEPKQMIKIKFEVLLPEKYCNKMKRWIEIGLTLFWEGGGGGGENPPIVQNRKSYEF